MIQPIQNDIGRQVIYETHEGGELGTITSFNERIVFVLYRGDVYPKGTSRTKLHWQHWEKGDS